MSYSQSIALHALLTIPGVGPQTAHRILSLLSTPTDIFTLSQEDFAETKLSPTIIKHILSLSTEDAEQAWAPFAKQDIVLLTPSDEDYPQDLKKYHATPPFIYARGNTSILNMSSIAIVGSRKYSEYGKHAATRFAHDIAAAGVHVVSGLALGIDAIAHEAAIRSDGPGTTIAVLGGGIDDASITPRSHFQLAKDILDAGGCIISPFPPSTTPNKGTFPARNRVMAAMSAATLVIEAGHKSGTLLTVAYAREYNKPVYAVPGSVFSPSSVGTNTLIANSEATLLQSHHDLKGICDAESDTHTAPLRDLTPEEQELIDLITLEPDGISINTLLRNVNQSHAQISSAITLLELEGIILHLGGGIYTTNQGK